MNRHLIYILFFCSINFIVFSYSVDIKPDMPAPKVDCISYTPYRHLGVRKNDLVKVPIEQLKNDLDKVSKISSCIRIYSSLGPTEDIIKYSRKKKMRVILGSYLARDNQINESEISEQIRLANTYDNIFMILVGNESLRRIGNSEHYIQLDQLLNYINRVKTAVTQPVSTGEIFRHWKNHPTLVRNVDFVTYHHFPYWTGVDIDSSIQVMINALKYLIGKYPDKFIFIGETGWPTAGPENKGAYPSLANQRLFLEKLTKKLRKVSNQLFDIRYNLVEAYDQPWKMNTSEGRVAAHWGLYDTQGKSKYMEQSFFSVFQYINLDLAFVTSFLGLLFNLLFFRKNKLTKLKAIFFACMALQLAASVIGFTLLLAISSYIFLAWSKYVVVPMLLILLFMLFATIKECASVLERDYVPTHYPKSHNNPKVSIHIACCNEPSGQVIDTIQSALNLDYQNFEIIIVDNNTSDAALWKPIEKFCMNKKNVHFYQISQLDGHKAGALNYALEKTSVDSEFIAVLDSDYVVAKNWLQETLGEFAAGVAAVQCPQSHRSDPDSTYQKLLCDEYDGFFQIGMVERSFDNAIIMHGTMIIICKKSLEEVGKWAEWSICEDAELGLRLLKSGKKLVYINKVLGQGLLPDSFYSFRKQRFRWVYGGTQIFLKNLKAFIGLEGGLTSGQRHHYFWWWLLWVVDSLYLLCCISSVFIALKMYQHAGYIPSIIFVVPMIYYVLHRFFCVFLMYRKRLGISLIRIMRVSIMGLSLTGVVSAASTYSFLTSKMKFHKTDKKGTTGFKQKWLAKFLSVPDCFFSIILAGLVVLIWNHHNSLYVDRIVWLLAFILLALPGISSMYLTAWSIYDKKPNKSP